MKIGIARAYNGEHRLYRRYAREMGAETFLFNIDTPNWINNLKNADVYIWHADSKEERYRIIHDRVYFIEQIIKKPIFPDMNMYFAYGDKIKENEIFNYFGLPTPKTYITYNREDALKISEKIKYTFVLKDAHVYGGWHVYKIKNREEADKYVNKIFSSRGLKHGQSIMKDYFLAQEMVEVDKDLRVIIIGDKVVCAYWRQAEAGGWKHNINQGSKPNFKNIPRKALKLCLDFHKKLGFHWMSYDLFITSKGKVLMNEFSCNFGIKAPTEAGYEIRKKQIEYIIFQVKTNKNIY